MATCSCILAWKIPWTEEPGGLQSMGLLRDTKCEHPFILDIMSSVNSVWVHLWSIMCQLCLSNQTELFACYPRSVLTFLLLIALSPSFPHLSKTFSACYKVTFPNLSDHTAPDLEQVPLPTGQDANPFVRHKKKPTGFQLPWFVSTAPPPTIFPQYGGEFPVAAVGLGNFAQVFHPFAQTVPSARSAVVQPRPTCNICLSIITSQGKPLPPRTEPPASEDKTLPPLDTLHPLPASVRAPGALCSNFPHARTPLL